MHALIARWANNMFVRRGKKKKKSTARIQFFSSNQQTDILAAVQQHMLCRTPLFYFFLFHNGFLWILLQKDSSILWLLNQTLGKSNFLFIANNEIKHERGDNVGKMGKKETRQQLAAGCYFLSHRRRRHLHTYHMTAFFVFFIPRQEVQVWDDRKAVNMDGKTSTARSRNDGRLFEVRRFNRLNVCLTTAGDRSIDPPVSCFHPIFAWEHKFFSQNSNTTLIMLRTQYAACSSSPLLKEHRINQKTSSRLYQEQNSVLVSYVLVCVHCIKLTSLLK